MLDAIVLGIVEGFTEFLPVSSTGHLIIVGDLLGYTGEKAATFQVVIQLGAILAVVWLYADRFRALTRSNSTNTGFQGKRGLQLLALTTFPALVMGFLLHGFIKSNLFTPFTVALGLIAGAVPMLLLERRRTSVTAESVDYITNRQALFIGIAQIASLWPGVSRAAATILGGMGAGLNRETAVQYSFLAAVPVMVAATSYDLIRSLPLLSVSDLSTFVAGFVVSFVAALVAITWFVRLAQTISLELFAWYRLVLATIVLAAL